LASARTHTYLRIPAPGSAFVGAQSSRRDKVAVTSETTTMELMVRLNVLAALLSFGLIAAIVVGVV